jgi:glycosyltransferase involved in cell wall biosynthesis
MKRKLPVIIAGMNCLSGVTSWADRLRAALADHPRYEVKLLHVGPDPNGDADIVARRVENACEAVQNLAPAILLPNYVWALFLTGFYPGVRCLGMCHADSEVEYYRPLAWYEPLVAKYIAVSRECDERLKQHVSYRAEDIITLPYGVCVPTSLNRDYQTNPLRLIYAGRVTQPQKRVWDFVPLVEQLLRSRVPFEFDIIGEGDEFAPLQQVMHSRIPAAKVNFIPRIPHCEMAAKWLSHDLFVQTSDFEGTSVSMLEAMAHGVVPVVTAASSGIAGVIEPEENGFVVPVGDMSAMAGVIARLANDQTLLSDVGSAAYGTAQLYSMDSYTPKFTRILDQLTETDGQIDYLKRYGYFSPPHPLLLQRQLLDLPRADVGGFGRGKLKRLFKRGLSPWRRRNEASPAKQAA